MEILKKLFGKMNMSPQDNISSSSWEIGNVHAEKLELDGEVISNIKKRYIAFDVETTGFSAYKDHIVELGAVVFESGVRVNQYSTLINPGIPIPEAASRVNHITNDMLSNAPAEIQVYPEFINFLGDALSGNTIICAHNARFDMDFLCETLMRLGYNGKIRYIDTLALSKKCLKLDSYKQDIVAASYGIRNQNEHRALNDAEVCGKILWKLLENQVDEKKQTGKNENSHNVRKLSEDEREICAIIQDAVLKRGGNSKWLRFYKNSEGYVDAGVLYSFLKLKIASKGKYIIIPANIETPRGLPVEKCSVNEGGTNNVRLYFSSPFNIEFLGDYIFSAYKKAETSMQLYFEQVNGVKNAEHVIEPMTYLSDDELQRLLEQAKSKRYDEISENIGTGNTIKREDIVVNAVHNRCPLSQIKNQGNFNKGFEAGFPEYEQAEKIRKSGDIEKAILLYDKARSVGYDAPALYVAYAKAFRKVKDYANEIVIIEEFFERNPKMQHGELAARKEKAMELLYRCQQVEREKAEKEAIKIKRLREKEEREFAKGKEPKINIGRSILQMDDDGNILKEYESIASASKEVGVSPKCIRDAAKGIQKHAGRFVWKYKDDLRIDE